MFFFKKLTDQKIKRKQNKGLPVTDFFGGVHPPEHKSPANLHEIKSFPLFDYYSVPLIQHIGGESELIVQVGQEVLKGQPLTIGIGHQVPIHAPTSGKVKGIVKQPSATYFSETVLSVLIESDKLDAPYVQSSFDYLSAKPEEIIEQIHLNGIAGLGGAGFPTALKLNHQQDGLRIDTVIINAAECEPYISADDRLMREHAEDLLRGLDIIRKVLHPKLILIGIEDNKQEAISALESALEQTRIDLVRLATKVIVVPTKYPSGGAKQLVKLLTGKEIPSGKHAADIGIAMLNVGTLFAIKRAIVDREPLIERVVTLAGQQFLEPANYWIRIGTPIETVLKQVDFDFTLLKKHPLIMGGPMMGFPISLQSSVVKATNCLLARTVSELGEVKAEQPCIRCGECTAVCPAHLLPQQLFWYSQGQDHEKSRAYHLFDCIECGACEYVCPSHIPLVHYYKVEKQLIKQIDTEERLSAEAKVRYETKLARLEAEKIARENRHKQISTDINEKDKSAVEAAIARVKAKKAAEEANASVDLASFDAKSEPKGSIEEVVINKSASSTRQDMVQAALARAKAKRALTNEPANEANEQVTTTQNNDHSTVAKTESIDATIQSNEHPSTDKVNPRKALVEAALLRAKEKRSKNKPSELADQETIQSIQSHPEISLPVVEQEAAVVDEALEIKTPRQLAVEAALLRAKAKRDVKRDIDLHEQSAIANRSIQLDEPKVQEAQEVPAVERVPEPPVTVVSQAPEITPKQAAIQAALLRAKAKRDVIEGLNEPLPNVEPDMTNISQVDGVKEKLSAYPHSDTLIDSHEQPKTTRQMAIEAALSKAKVKRDTLVTRSEKDT